MNTIYTNDKEKYGDPANNSSVTTADPNTLPAWQITLARHAALVAPHVESESSARKRQRTVDPEQDNEDVSMDSAAPGPGPATSG
jgi:hypothetical protein